ncbi:MAG: trypsin-like serine protease [Sulfitobacter sp.]
MRFVFVSAIFLSFCMAHPVVAQNTNLTRLGDKNRALGWEAVGRLDTKNGGFCTGTLIAPDLVLTAAHCVMTAAKRASDKPPI